MNSQHRQGSVNVAICQLDKLRPGLPLPYNGTSKHTLTMQPNIAFQCALIDVFWQSISLRPGKSVSSLGNHLAKCPKLVTYCIQNRVSNVAGKKKNYSQSYSCLVAVLVGSEYKCQPSFIPSTQCLCDKGFTDVRKVLFSGCGSFTYLQQTRQIFLSWNC